MNRSNTPRPTVRDAVLRLMRAYHVAMQPPRGPVFVSIPADDWDRETDWVRRRAVSQAVAPDPQSLRRVADALAACRRPAFVAGAGVDRDGAVDKLVALAR